MTANAAQVRRLAERTRKLADAIYAGGSFRARGRRLVDAIDDAELDAQGSAVAAAVFAIGITSDVRIGRLQAAARELDAAADRRALNEVTVP